MNPSPLISSSLAILNQLQGILSTLPNLRLAIVYGSVAKGTASATSDVDIAVDIGNIITVPQHIDLVEKIATQIGRPVDLIDLKRVGEPLLGQILRYGKKIIGSNTEYSNLIVRHLFNQADFIPLQQRILAERRQAWIGQ